MRTVLVTGAGGLLGSALVPLLAAEHRVVAVARETVAAAPNIEPLAMDLSQPLDSSVLPERIDAVVYLAQSPRFREFPGGAGDVRRVNVDQPLALIEEARARGATSFVYASSGSVYAPSPEPLSEEAPTPANGFYAASKLAAELLLRPYSAVMNVALLRFFFIYGAGQKHHMLLPRLVDSVREGRTVPLRGQDGLRINPIHADDAARAAAAALQLEGAHTVNVAGPEELSLRRVCEIASAALGKPPQFEVHVGEAQHLVADTRRMEALLGRPRTRLEDAIGELL